MLTANLPDSSKDAAAQVAMYTGPERRIHRVLVTKNTEYHMRRKRCVRVRDRRTGAWLEEHQALSKELLASVAVDGEGAYLNVSGIPAPGEQLYFGSVGGHIVTSPVLDVSRPPKSLVQQEYPPIF